MRAVMPLILLILLSSLAVDTETRVDRFAMLVRAFVAMLLFLSFMFLFLQLVCVCVAVVATAVVSAVFSVLLLSH